MTSDAKWNTVLDRLGRNFYVLGGGVLTRQGVETRLAPLFETLGPGGPAALRQWVEGEAGWQPIETAPKNGRRVLLWSEMWEMTWGVTVGEFFDGKWHCGEGSVAEDEVDEFSAGNDDEGDPISVGPSHWRPLPASPAAPDGAPTYTDWADRANWGD